MFKKGAWIIVNATNHKYFGCEGEIQDYEYGSYYASRRWEVLLNIEDGKELKIYISEKDMMVVDKEIDSNLKKEAEYQLLKHQIDEAPDKRDWESFYALTERLKVIK